MTGITSVVTTAEQEVYTLTAAVVICPDPTTSGWEYPMESLGRGRSVVLVRARSWTCALRIEDAIEIMRPLPIQPLAGVPDFVRGLAIVRGKVLPVLDLA